MSFEEMMLGRDANVFADFFIDKLTESELILDCGCGEGAISAGLVQYVPSGSIVGIDLEIEEFQPVSTYLKEKQISNLNFAGASILELPFPSNSFSACLCHSSIETLPDPVEALKKISRVLRPGGLFGIAAVEYEGLLIAGEQEVLLRKFYEVREALWRLEGIANPRMGKHLRKLLHLAGFEEVEAHARYISHGSKEEIGYFGNDRAANCESPWYVENALAHKLVTREEFKEIQAAWQRWAEAPDSFVAFTWCRALGWKPK
ncbi:MAG: methyltransferase domain-containing protein [Chloroflexota bacterium]